MVRDTSQPMKVKLYSNSLLTIKGIFSNLFKVSS
jgi:hypothetical protein